MARPGRPEIERELVIAAAGDVDRERPSLSAARLGRVIAQRVVGELMQDINRDRADFLSVARRLASELEPTPVAALATDDRIDTAALFRRARMARFEARGCRHLTEAEWAGEDRDIAKDITATLAGRYSRYLQDFSRKLYLRKSGDGMVDG